MKQKRFIKLLMGAGFSRNTAATVAKATALSTVPRASMVENILGWWEIFKRIPECVPHMDKSLHDAAKKTLLGGTENA